MAKLNLVTKSTLHSKEKRKSNLQISSRESSTSKVDFFTASQQAVFSDFWHGVLESRRLAMRIRDLYRAHRYTSARKPTLPAGRPAPQKKDQSTDVGFEWRGWPLRLLIFPFRR